MSSLPGWLAAPELVPLWDRVRDRFERAGLVAEGRVRVPLTSREERRVAGGLLGRTLTRPTVTIDLAWLDARLRERSGVGGLEAVLVRLGGPLQDRPAERTGRADARERPLELARELADAGWGSDWVAGLRRTGLLTGQQDAEGLVRHAAAVLGELLGPRGGRASQSRVELAGRVLGDAHALDRDRVVHHLVLRGLAAAAGTPLPQDSDGRAELWSRFGVEPDLLSRTCLMWRIRVDGSSSLARRLDLAADDGDPIHLTEWDLRRATRFAVGDRVLVCENPRVLEAVAETKVEGWAAVCTAGEANLVVRAVLAGLVDAGARLRFHGDFDWPGVAIANRVIQRYQAEPWRLSAADYLDGVHEGAPLLVGPPGEPSWDPELGAAMRRVGRVVHEETVLGPLLESLAG